MRSPHAPGFRVAACGLARNDGLVVFVIPALRLAQDKLREAIVVPTRLLRHLPFLAMTGLSYSLDTLSHKRSNQPHYQPLAG